MHTHSYANTHLLHTGFSAVPLTCTSVYSYYWWIVAYEFVVICTLALAVVGGWVERMRLAWVGIIAVASVLYIQSADSFLAVTSIKVRCVLLLGLGLGLRLWGASPAES